MTGLVCFDLDGVIADSRDAISHCFDLALAELGLPPLGPGAIDRYVGPPLQETFTEVLHAAGQDLARVDQCIATYRRHYAVESLRRTTSYPGVEAMLTEVAAMSRVVVVTSKPLVFAEPILKALGVAGCFEAWFGPTTDRVHEAKTETLAGALEAVPGYRPPVIMVGDRRHDVAAALANGAIPVGVLWGFGSRDELEAAGAVHLAATPEDLVPMIDAILKGHPTT